MKWADKRAIYTALPAFVKRAVHLIPYSVMAGSAYRRKLDQCNQFETMSRSGIISYQEQTLGKLLHFVAEEVPFYYKYRSIVDKLPPFDALKEFPIISKSDVQLHFEEFVPKSIKSIPHHNATTGGSSGNQLLFYEDDDSYAREMAYMHSQWRRVGYSPEARKATFRGVTFRRIGKKVFWQENPIHNELQFSPFHMSEENLSRYIERLIAYRPRFINGYPSGIELLSEFILRHQLTELLPPISAALLGSEECSDTQRDRITKALNTRVFTWYGHSERCVLAGECEHTQVYHQFPNYGIVEIVKEDGQSCEFGESGEIVGTSFINKSMPLLRYRTDDYAVKQVYACECGRNWDRFSDVVGRWSIEGFVVSRTGAKISASALNMHGDLFKNVTRYQYYQNTIGVIEIRAVVSDKFTELDERTIIQEHRKKLWDEMDVYIRRVAAIPLTKSGKQRRLIREIEVKEGSETSSN